jgi:hypothetical protein
MTAIVWNRPEVRWLPSRHRYAATRLIAFVMLRRARLQTIADERVALPIDRDQSQPEYYAMAIWLYATIGSYFAAVLPGWWKLAALLLPSIVLQLVLYVVGLVVAPLLASFGVARRQHNQQLQSWSMLALITVASSYFATVPTAVRFVAFTFFGVLAVNGVAYLVMLLLRKKVREMEAACGV